MLETTIATKVYRIWVEEVPWFTAHVAANYPDLASFADTMAHTVYRGPAVEWAAMEGSDLIPSFDAAMADLSAGRVDREDHKRILPRWTDGSYHP